MSFLLHSVDSELLYMVVYYNGRPILAVDYCIDTTEFVDDVGDIGCEDVIDGEFRFMIERHIERRKPEGLSWIGADMIRRWYIPSLNLAKEIITREANLVPLS